MLHHHMLAVFDRETAKAPPGLFKFDTQTAPHLHTPDEDARVEEACREHLERAYSASRPTARKLALLGHGNGFTFEASPFCSHTAEGGVHVLFAGEVGAWPGVNAVAAAHDAFIAGSPPPEASDAAWLLDFYRSFFSGGAVGADADRRALESLAQVEGSFAFVIFDEAQHHVFAARDAGGSQPLYWGATQEGQLLFGSHLEDLDACNPSATLFPAGTLFASERHTIAFSPGDRGWVISEDGLPGQLFAFVRGARGWRGVKAIPRLTPAGAVCGAVYRVESDSALAAAAAAEAPPSGARARARRGAGAAEGGDGGVNGGGGAPRGGAAHEASAQIRVL